MGELKVSKFAAKREARIADILQCAMKHFAQKGFHGAGISGIAADCGMSVGHLYHYFSSKDELIRAIVEMEMSRQHESIAAFENLPLNNFQDELIELLTSILATDKEPFRTVLNFEILAEADRNPEVAEMLQRNDEQMRRQFSAVIQRAGIDKAEVRTELLFTIFSGLSARALRHPEQERVALLETMKGVILSIFNLNCDED